MSVHLLTHAPHPLYILRSISLPIDTLQDNLEQFQNIPGGFKIDQRGWEVICFAICGIESGK